MLRKKMSVQYYKFIEVNQHGLKLLFLSELDHTTEGKAK